MPPSSRRNTLRSRSSSHSRRRSRSCPWCAPDAARSLRPEPPVLGEGQELVVELNRPAHCVVAHNERARIVY
jgi:hypothetical protein